MPYIPETRKTPEARKKINAAHLRWLEKYKLTNPQGYARRKEQQRLRAPKYQQKRNEYQKRMWAEDPQRGLAYGRKYRRKKLEAMAGRPKPDQCEVCDNGEGKIFFDHCHQSGEFRGWICYGCNTILGHAHDSVDHLRKLIAYLER